MSAGSPRRFGLLIGIGEYPRIGERARLLGPANDVRALGRVLRGKFGFEARHLRILVDADATRDSILRSLDELVARAGDGDQVVIHFSGHGSQILDVHGDEADGLDETWVPYDGRRDGVGFSGDISDHEIAQRLAGLERRGAFVTINLDCCHSGHAHRSHAATRIRRLPPPGPTASRRALRSANPQRSLFKNAVARRRLIFAACRDDQLAGERELAGSFFGEWTWALVQALEQMQSGMGARQVFERAAATLAAEGIEQWPMLLGDGERRVFGLERLPFARHLKARRRSADRWVLSGGAALGLSPGSRWRLLPTETTDLAATPGWGPFELSEVGPFESLLQIDEAAAVDMAVPSDPEIDHGTLWALEVEAAYGDRRLPVAIHCDLLAKPEAEVSRLLTQVRSSPYLRELGIDEPIPPESLHLWPDGQATDHLGARLALPAESHGAGCLERLERRARARLGLQLENRDPHSRLGHLLDLRLLTGKGDGVWKPAPSKDGFSTEFLEGDLLAIDLEHAYPDGLYVYVLDFGLSDHVTQIFPEPGGAELLLPGLQLSIGKQTYDELELIFPPAEELPPPSHPGEPPQGLGFLKVFATTSPTDFSWITTEIHEPENVAVANREAANRGANRLESLLALGRIQPALRHRDDWTCVRRAIHLRRRI